MQTVFKQAVLRQSMQASRRDFLRLLTLSLSGLALGAGTGCQMLPPAGSVASAESADAGDSSLEAAGVAPTAAATATPAIGPGPAVAATPPPSSIPAARTTPGVILTVAVPPTPTTTPTVPHTPAPTATPRTRPQHALLTVPYYSQHVGRQNYCLPTSIAMVADRYDRLPPDIAGSAVQAPRYVADVAYRLARERIAALDEGLFTTLWEEVDTDPLGGLIWNVFAPNGRDLAVGMSPALAYLVLTFAFGLPPMLGTLDECLIALADDVPSILFGSYAPLRRADGLSGNVGGYTGDHAIVLVGVELDRVLANDPLPSDKTRYAGERSRATASSRAVRFELASVQRMTRGDRGEPRADCFMVAPQTA